MRTAKPSAVHLMLPAPPGRRSISAVSPNQEPSPSAVVSAAHTFSCGWASSTVRSMRSGKPMMASEEIATDWLLLYGNRSVASIAVDADVVDQHGLRERRRVVRRNGGGAADGHVEQQVEIVVEDPGPAVQIRRRHGVVARLVEVPADPVRLPVDRVDVKVAGERGAGLERAGNSPAAGVPGQVDGPVNPGGVGTEVLHHVDLAAARPADPVDVRAEQPERGPYPAPCGQLDPRLDQPVPQRLQVLADQPRGRVPAAVVAAGSGIGAPDGDRQLAGAVECRVGGLAGVVLQLGVAPAVPAGLRLPGSRARRVADRPVELLGPGERVPRGPGHVRRAARGSRRWRPGPTAGVSPGAATWPA